MEIYIYISIFKNTNTKRNKMREEIKNWLRQAEEVKVPKEMLFGIRDLNPEYLVSRYPDIAGGIPADIYDSEIVEKHLKITKGF